PQPQGYPPIYHAGGLGGALHRERYCKKVSQAGAVCSGVCVIKAILLDIEGTTSSLSFVRDVLFPYSRERMADFIGSHLNDVEVRKLLEDARAVAGQQLNNAQLIQQLLRWADED